MPAVRHGVLLGLLAASLFAACAGDGSPESTARAGDPTATSTSSATVAPLTPSIAGNANDSIEEAAGEIAAALGVAEGIRDALERASIEGTWAPVLEACAAYPTGAPAVGEIPQTLGLRTAAQRPELWPPAYAELDTAAATACFLVTAAQSIPPDARIDEQAPTTAEIVAQGVVSALDATTAHTEEEIRALLAGSS